MDMNTTVTLAAEREAFKPSTFTLAEDEACRLATKYEADVTIFRTKSGKFTLTQRKDKCGSVATYPHTTIGGVA